MKTRLGISALAFMLGGTGLALYLSVSGAALPGMMLDEPVSIRQGSTDWRSRRGAGVPFLYFGPSSRRHLGGSHGFGK